MLKTIFCTCLALTLMATAEPVADLLKSAEKSVSEKRLEDALEQYKAAFGQDEKSITALYNIGWIYNEQHKYDTAARWLKKGAALDPKDARIQHELGFALSKLNNSEGSVAAYTQATLLQPERADSWVGLGDAYYELRSDYMAATRAYLKAVELGTNSAPTLYRLGWCQNHQNQFKEAQANLKRAADAEPKSAPIWLEWGYSLLRDGKNDEAAQALTRALVIDPKLRLGHLYLGRAYIGLRNKQLAKRQVEELRALDHEMARQLDAELRKLSGNGN